MVGVMSIAVPTAMTISMIANISSVGLVEQRLQQRRSALAGRLATVISQALTIAAATRNMITAVVLAAATKTP